MPVHIAPSVLAADLAALGDAVARVEAACDWLHLDVFDGVAVANLSFGPPVVAALRRRSSLFFDVHLCVARPGDYVTPLAAAGADQIAFHPSAVADEAAGAAMVRAIIASGRRAGVALAPEEPWELAAPLVAAGAACVNVLCVRPGFGGQAFQPAQLAKVTALRAAFPALDIQVDGGVAADTIGAAAAAGANAFVAGTAVFGAADPAAAARELARLATAAQAGGGGGSVAEAAAAQAG
jgi:ribulose-phosphate 3-epimerase